MNKLILSGNLTRDPELTETSSGITVCRFAIAVNRDYTKDNERVVDFFNITVWRTQAENCNKYLRKGSKVLVTASIQNRSYEDKEGNKRLVTDIIAENVEFIGSPQNTATNGNERPTQANKEPQQTTLEEIDDILPF